MNKSAATSEYDDDRRLTVHSKGTTVRPKKTRVQRTQNTLLIWLDNKIDANSADSQNAITQLRKAANYINIFTDADPCVDFLTDIANEKAFMLISDPICDDIIPLIHDITQLHTIFIFCANQTAHEECVKKWPKIWGIFTEISPICEALKKAGQQCEQNAISISFVTTSDGISKKNLNQLDPIFMYSQILKEILLTIKFDDGHINAFINHCRAVIAKTNKEMKQLDILQTEYHKKTPIWWYTCESNMYSMLNSALRLMDMDIIIKMGFFIGDLHRHIEQLYSEQPTGSNSKEVFIVYRGQGMPKTDFDQMKETQGGLISFNNFLSTSKNWQVSFCFAESNGRNSDLVGILFIITVDPTKSKTPFASIIDDNVGCYGDNEEEVLFSLHTVFRIGEIKPMDETQPLFQVQLTLTGNDDEDLRVLTDRIREETFPGYEGWQRLGVLLLKVGECAKAQQVYEILLKQTADVNQEALIYSQLACAKLNQGEYKEAITSHEKSLEILQKTRPPTYWKSTSCYNNIGLIYLHMGDYQKALSSLEKGLEIRKELLPSNYSDLHLFYNNFGMVYFKMSDYPKALSSHEKALEIGIKSLPSNHPDLGDSYNNIGKVYFKMSDYSTALSSLEKGLEIQKQSLPSNHPHLGNTYNSIGLVYINMGNYPKALSSHEKALEIGIKLLPSNHPDLGDSYNNIGKVYFNMGDYPQALSYYEKALEIQKQSLRSNHSGLCSPYGSIGNVYIKMGDYPKAFSYFEKALELRKKLLPVNHPDLGSS